MTADSQEITVFSSDSKIFKKIRHILEYVYNNSYSFNINIDNFNKFKFLMLDINSETEELQHVKDVLNQIQMYKDNDLLRYEAEIMAIIYILYILQPQISVTQKYVEELQIRAEEIYGIIYPSRMKALKMYADEHNCNKLHCMFITIIIIYLLVSIIGLSSIGFVVYG